MNWLCSFLYYVFIIFQYLMIGKALVSFSKLKEKLSYYLITGFFSTYAIAFLVAFPSQVFRISWKTYFILQLIVFLFIDILCFFKNKTFFQSLFNKNKLSFSNVKVVFSRNWLLVLFVILFTIFSMSNQVQYYDLNYDDYYYIGKMVNLVDSPQLFNENYYNGSLEVATVGLNRLVNTYELSYSFFATLFHVDIPFFCRVTMIIHNYWLFAIVFKELASKFVKEDYAQYTLLPFFFFLIPAGWLYHGINLDFLNISFYIRSYDLWQFQTAAFYGGSIVRMIAIPALYIYSEPLIQKMNFRNFIVVMLVCISFLGFSSVFMQILVLFLFFILLGKLIYLSIKYYKNGNKKRLILNISLIMFLIFSLFFTKLIDNFAFFNLEKYTQALNDYLPFIDVWYKQDLFLNFGWIFVLFCCLYCLYKRNLSVSFWAVILCIFIVFRSNYFPEFIITSAFNYFFVPLRTVSSLQYIFVFAFGTCFVQFSSWIFSSKIFYNLTSIVSVILVLIYFSTHYQVICSQNFLGSGISSAGWDFSRVFDLGTKMMPKIFVEVGDYFNNLPYGNYNLYTPGAFDYENHVAQGAGFVMSSNRIVTHIGDGMNLTSSEIKSLDNFCKENGENIDNIINICKKQNIDYLIVFNDESKNLLEANGCSLVLQGIQTNYQDYYLFKL